jgi:hypothetical protein
MRNNRQKCLDTPPAGELDSLSMEIDREEPLEEVGI